MDQAALEQARLVSWRQTSATAIPDSASAIPLIERVGVATLYPVSSEIPNLFHAYTGSPTTKTDSGWDTASGQVYGWRWELGRAAAAFYTAIIRGRPTWVSWELLPAVLRLRGELREIEEVYHAGEISRGAYRIHQALTEAGGVLGTGALRRAADFPTGKEQRAAYLKAIAELDTRLLLAKVFAAEEKDTDMQHALVGSRYPQLVEVANALTREAALDQFLLTYLPAAIYVIPSTLAKHLGLPSQELQAALERLGERLKPTIFAGQRGSVYLWQV